MAGFLQALAEWLGFEPAPGTPEHREALFRVVKEINDERSKPPGQRDAARLLELTKRRLRLRIQALQVGRTAGPGGPAGVVRRRPPTVPAALVPCCPFTPNLPCRCNLQAKKQLMRRNAEQLLQCLDLGCCRDCPRVRQREAASLQAMAAWQEQWELISSVWLRDLEQGHPYSPLTFPDLELQLYLPEGLPEDFPPSIDRCAACQGRLEEVR